MEIFPAAHVFKWAAIIIHAYKGFLSGFSELYNGIAALMFGELSWVRDLSLCDQIYLLFHENEHHEHVCVCP